MNKVLESNELFLDDIVLAWGKKNPEKTAIIYRDQDLTYAQLEKRVQMLAAGLDANGVGKGDFVATLLAPGLDITPALLAISRVGAIYTPLDPEHPDDQLLERLETVQAKLIIQQSDYRERTEAWSTASKLVDQLLMEGVMSRKQVRCEDRKLEEPACIFFTSGTTGKAKGVVGSFLAQRNSILEPTESLGFSESVILDSIARYAWSISMLEMLSPLVVGGTSIILDRSAALNLDELYEWAKKCTAFHCPPALLRRLADHIINTYPGEPLKNIHTVWYGGDTFSLNDIQMIQSSFPEAKVGTAYGCTEIFGLSHVYWYDADNMPDSVLIGKPVGHMLQRLLDSEKVEVEPGEEGEIYLGGNRIALEYFNMDELNNQKFFLIDQERFFATGDYGRLDHNGDLVFLERKDSQVKIRGIRIELGEVEHLLRTSANVKDVVVLALEQEGGERELRAYVVFQADESEDVIGLRNRLKDLAPDYLIPTVIHALPAMPLTENFKIDRKALAKYEPVQRTSSQIIDELEIKIAAIWKNAGNVIAHSSFDSFFDLGGNSLTAALLAAKLSRQFQKRVEVADIYAQPTLVGQANLLRKSAASIQAVNINAGPLNVSEGQKGLVFRELFEKRDGSITCTRYIGCSDGYDDEKLRQAFTLLASRYPTINTHIKFQKRNLLLEKGDELDGSEFIIERKQGVWSVDGKNAPPLEKHSFRFDIKHGPLIAGVISKMVDGGELLQLTAHHVAADDNSMGRIAVDFARIYDGLIRKAEPELALVTYRYEEFVYEQQTRIENGEFADATQYMANRLLNHLDQFPEPILKEQDPGISRSREMESGAVNHPFSVYVAALSWAMSHCFEQNSFVYCAHVALQRDSETDPRVGMFVNLLPLFISVDPETSVEEHINNTKRGFDAAMAHSNVPYEQILQNSQALRRMGKYPFDAFVNELHFGDVYPAGYRDVVVPRNFSTGGEEISMSVLHLESGNHIKYESPAFKDDHKILDKLAMEVEKFLAQV